MPYCAVPHVVRQRRKANPWQTILSLIREHVPDKRFCERARLRLGREVSAHQHEGHRADWEDSVTGLVEQRDAGKVIRWHCRPAVARLEERRRGGRHVGCLRGHPEAVCVLDGDLKEAKLDAVSCVSVSDGPRVAGNVVHHLDAGIDGHHVGSECAGRARCRQRLARTNAPVGARLGQILRHDRVCA
eukprot:363711-Chlamydomonas_euryale.AAC.10